MVVLITQCSCNSVLWQTGSHCIIIFIIHNFISLLLTLRKSKLNLFRLSLCEFSDLVIGFRELFSNSTSQDPPSHLAIMRTIWSEWTRSEKSPLARSKIPLECLLGPWMYIIHCALSEYSAFRLISVVFFYKVKSFSLNVRLSLLLVQQHCSIIVRLLSDYCSIAVQYSDPENVFQLFWSFKEVTITYNLESITSNQVQNLPTFILA
jgi:hypothetical protein